MRVRNVCRPCSILALPLLLAFPLHAQSGLAALMGVQGSSVDLILRTATDSEGRTFELDPGLRATSEDPGGTRDITVDPPGNPLNFEAVCADRDRGLRSSSREEQMPSCVAQQAVPDGKTESPADRVRASSALIAHPHELADRNLDIYYRNRREFSLDVGWHPVNIPFIYDFAVGDSYDMTPLKYTVVPIVASLRWHVTNVGWKWIFRGNMDFTFSGSITAIPRGPETHYYSFDFGIRRNFVYRNWKVVPFFEQRGGAGIINAKEPLGVVFAQGQNLTFTYNLGVGARYNLNSKYSFSAGMNYMHISNAYLSQPQFYNYGINVYGPMFGLDMRLGKPRHHASE